MEERLFPREAVQSYQQGRGVLLRAQARTALGGLGEGLLGGHGAACGDGGDGDVERGRQFAGELINCNNNNNNL